VPAGGVEPKHSHPHCVTISLADFDAEIKTFPDGKTIRAHQTFGSVSGLAVSIRLPFARPATTNWLNTGAHLAL